MSHERFEPLARKWHQAFRAYQDLGAKTDGDDTFEAETVQFQLSRWYMRQCQLEDKLTRLYPGREI